jgi:hypothetical protein
MEWNKPKIKFYNYYFKGMKKPIIMEAYSKEDADSMLTKLSEKSKTKIPLERLEDIRIEMPLSGISERKRLGNTYVWVGINITSDGWLEKEEFKKRYND